jgi:NADH dehydrogenase FAD-containing subunit
VLHVANGRDGENLACCSVRLRLSPARTSAATFEEAQRLRSVLDAAPATAPVTVVGAAPTDIEAAAEQAEAGRTVTLVCGGLVGPYLHPNGHRSVAERLAGLGVTALQGPDAKITEVTGDSVRLGGGRELSSEVTIWTAGFGVRTWPPAAGSAPTPWAAFSRTRP